MTAPKTPPGTRRRVGALLLGAALVAGAAACEPATSRPERPYNVVFIVADDLRNTLGAYGDAVVRTPNFDRLARRGVLFDRAYVQYPICNPSRTSMLTGLLPESTRVMDNRTYFRTTLPDIVTLPQLFRQHGYFTASLGKIFHRSGMSTGEHAWADSASWSHIRFYEPTEMGMRGVGGEVSWARQEGGRWLAAEGEDEDQPDGQIAAEAVRLIEERGDAPFFIGIGFHKPHVPFVAPKEYFDLYPVEDIELVSAPPDRSLNASGALPAVSRRIPLPTDQEAREIKRAYLAAVSFMDAQLGKVMDALDRNGLWESTIVVFVGDHGFHLGEQEWWGKSTLFEPATRAPLVVYVPGARGNGRTAPGLVELLDLYPTLVELAAFEAPHALQGESLVRLLDRPGLPGRDAAYTVVGRGRGLGRSIRTERWRYTEWNGGAEGVELYDHLDDPGEHYNLARDSAHAATVAELRRTLRERRP